MSEKLQKVLARAGLGSRRALEGWIRAGRVSVNGETAALGCRVNPQDKLQVDGQPVVVTSVSESLPRILLYHKPIGEMCTRSDPEGRPTVFERLPLLKSGRWISVGRLDFNTSGLLLFTDAGEIANQLMHPSAQLEREYAVRIFGEVTPEVLKRLVTGVRLEDGLARFEEVVDSGGEGRNHWYHVVVVTGRNRLVRRLWESQGVQVSRLKRVRFGPVFLEASLRQGHWRYLDPVKDKAVFDRLLIGITNECR